MYDPLSRYYEEIFPVSENQIQFVLSTMYHRNSGHRQGGEIFPPQPPLRLLDVGCAVGDLAAGVVQSGTGREIEVDAIDLNSAMIQQAEARHSRALQAGGLRFHQMDMLKIGHEFQAEHFNAVACLGNTLVHLPGPVEIAHFLHSSARILRARPNIDGDRQAGDAEGTVGGRGCLILQQLNYDYLLEERPKKLPLIETEQVRFEREYSYTTGSGIGSGDIRVLFTTRLHINETGEVHEDSVELYPLRRRELKSLLKSAGFGQPEFYGSFDGSPLKADSFPLIAVADLQTW